MKVRAVNKLGSVGWSDTQSAITGNNVIAPVSGAARPARRAGNWHAMGSHRGEQLAKPGNRATLHIGWGYYQGQTGEISRKDTQFVLVENSYTPGDPMMQFDPTGDITKVLDPPKGTLVVNLSRA